MDTTDPLKSTRGPLPSSATTMTDPLAPSSTTGSDPLTSPPATATTNPSKPSAVTNIMDHSKPSIATTTTASAVRSLKQPHGDTVTTEALIGNNPVISSIPCQAGPNPGPQQMKKYPGPGGVKTEISANIPTSHGGTITLPDTSHNISPGDAAQQAIDGHGAPAAQIGTNQGQQPIHRNQVHGVAKTAASSYFPTSHGGTITMPDTSHKISPGVAGQRAIDGYGAPASQIGTNQGQQPIHRNQVPGVAKMAAFSYFPTTQGGTVTMSDTSHKILPGDARQETTDDTSKIPPDVGSHSGIPAMHPANAVQKTIYNPGATVSRMSPGVDTATGGISAIHPGNVVQGTVDDRSTPAANMSPSVGSATGTDPTQQAVSQGHPAATSSVGEQPTVSRYICRGWDDLKFAINWIHGRKLFQTEGSSGVCPVKLQFALKKNLDDCVETMENNNIKMSHQDSSITFELDGTEFRNGEEVKSHIIKMINEHVINDLKHIAFGKDTENGMAVSKALEHAIPQKIERGFVKVFETNSSICLVGKKESFDKVAEELNIEVKQKTVSECGKTRQNLYLNAEELDCLQNLEFEKHCKEKIDDVYIDYTNGELVGHQHSISQARAVLEEFQKRLVTKNVDFKPSDCAKIFLEKNGKDNVNVLAYVYTMLKSSKIKACYVSISKVRNLPEVKVTCRDDSSAQRARDVVSGCVNIHRIAKFDSEEAKKFLNEWHEKKKLYIADGDEKCFTLICTSDLSPNIMDINARILSENTPLPVSFSLPPLVIKFFATFGEGTIRDTEDKFDVKINIEVDENKMYIRGPSGQAEKDAKHYIKCEIQKRLKSLTVQIPDATFTQSLPKLEDTIARHECCWNSKSTSKAEELHVKNGSYVATWYDPSNHGKVTLIEGNPAELDVDLLLLFVTDNLFPVHQDFLEHKTASDAYVSAIKSLVDKHHYSIGEAILIPCKNIGSKPVMSFVIRKTQEEFSDESLNLMLSLGKVMDYAYKQKYQTVGLSMSLPSDIPCRAILQKVTTEAMTYFQDHPDVSMEICLCGNQSTAPIDMLVESLDKVFTKSRGIARKLYNNTAISVSVSSRKRDLKVKVKQGSLHEYGADVIVNTTSRNLQLDQGFVSNLILREAGNTIQDECLRKYPVGISYGEIAITSAGKLQKKGVKHIFHGALPPFDVREHMNQVKQFVRACLFRADMVAAKTIAFPALGVGNLGYPRRNVAAAMFDAVDKFQAESLNSRLEKVVFIVFAGDEEVCRAFFDEEWRRSKSGPTQLGLGQDQLRIAVGPPVPCLRKCVVGSVGRIVITVASRDKIGRMPTYCVMVILRLGKLQFTRSPGEIQFLKTASDSVKRTWNDHLEILLENPGALKSAAQTCIAFSENNRVTDLVIYTSTSLKIPEGEQAKMIVDTFVSHRSFKYLQAVTVAVDNDAAFHNAEVALLPQNEKGRFSRFFSSTTEDWQKLEQHPNLGTEITINVIAKNESSLNTVVGEVESILGEASVGGETRRTSPHPGPQQQPPVHLLPDKGDGNHNNQGARPKTTQSSRNVQEVPDTSGDEGFDEDSVFGNVTAEVCPAALKLSYGNTEWLTKFAAQFEVKVNSCAPKVLVIGRLENIMKFEDELYKVTQRGQLPGLGNADRDENTNYQNRFSDESGSDDTETPTVSKDDDIKLLPDAKYEHYRKPELDVGKTIRKPATTEIYAAMNFLFKEDISHIIKNSSGMSYVDGEICIETGSSQVVEKKLDSILAKMREVQNAEVLLDANEIMKANDVVQGMADTNNTLYYYFVPNDSKIVIMGFDYQKVKEAENKVKKNLGRTQQQTSSRDQRKFDTNTKLDHAATEQGNDERHMPLSRPVSADCVGTIGGVTVKIYKGNITKLQVDCIVNAANERLSNSIGVAQAISRAAGWMYDEECRVNVQTYGQLMAGEIRETTAGGLPCKFVIQAVASRLDVQMQKTRHLDILTETIQKCLYHADGRGVSSIALPSIAAGGNTGLTVDECARQYCSAVSSFCSRRQSITEIHFVDINTKTVDAIKSAFAPLFDGRDAGNWSSKGTSSFAPSFTSQSSPAVHSATAVSGSVSMYSPDKAAGSHRSVSMAGSTSLRIQVPEAGAGNPPSYSDVVRSKEAPARSPGEANQTRDSRQATGLASGGYNTRSKAKAGQATVSTDPAASATSRPSGISDISFVVPSTSVNIRLVQGDIVATPADAIVSIEDKSFSGAGAIARKIRKHGHDAYRNAHSWLKNYNRTVDITEVVVTESFGGKLVCKHVFHTIAPHWGKRYTQVAGDFERDIRITVKHILQKAADMKLRSVALPFFGTSVDEQNYSTPVPSCCTSIVAGIMEWVCKSHQHSIDQIILVCTDSACLLTFKPTIEDKIQRIAESQIKPQEQLCALCMKAITREQRQLHLTCGHISHEPCVNLRMGGSSPSCKLCTISRGSTIA